MPGLYDRVRDTSTVTGTGAVTVSGTPAVGCAALSTVPTGTVIDYSISGQSGTEFEVGRGTVTGATTFSRDSVVTSSNSNNAVTFSAGTKDVMVVVAARSIVNRGRALALNSAYN